MHNDVSKQSEAANPATVAAGLKIQDCAHDLGPGSELCGIHGKAR